MNSSNTLANETIEKNPPVREGVDRNFKHYELKKLLGEGGFGQVFEAWDSLLCRRVALKIMKDLGGDTATLLVKEARLAASLQHSGFVKIHAIESDGVRHAVVMELVDGLTLKEWKHQNSGSEKHALGIILQVVIAMIEAHASGLIHGDLKPSNVIVEPSGKVKILDFGMAAKAEHGAAIEVKKIDPMGTIAYMAPECLTGGVLSPQSDIYALGAILFEMISGSRPFANLHGLNLAAALVQSNSDQWEYTATMSPQVVQLIRAMTARSIDARCVSMVQVKARIDTILAEPSDADLPSQKASGFLSFSLGENTLLQSRRSQLLAMGFVVVSLFGLWKIAPYTDLIPVWFQPYSEAMNMRRGLQALTMIDRVENFDVAQQNFEEVLTHNPENAAAIAGLSLLYSFKYASDAQDEVWHQKAIAAAQHAMNLNPQLSIAHVAKSFVLGAQGKREEALLSADQALVLDPTNVLAFVAKIGVLRVLGRLEEAKQVAIIGTARFPKERVFWDALGDVLNLQGEHQAAESAFRKSVKLQPDGVYAYANLSLVLTRLGRHEEALQILQQGLQIRPSARLYRDLGFILFQKGDYEAAVGAFESAISTKKGNPADYINWANLADTLLWIPARKSEATLAYRKAIELLHRRIERMPNDATLVSQMGLYSARVGDATSARQFAEKALSLAPKNASVHFRAALAHELLNDRALALIEITKARELGYSAKYIEAEPDLAELRKDPAYQQ